MSSDQPTAADVRAVAVARLKRATSLPRMKNGRRPPMHGEAFSEGEKPSNQNIEDDTDASSNTPQPEPQPHSMSSTPQPHDTPSASNLGPSSTPDLVASSAQIPHHDEEHADQVNDPEHDHDQGQEREQEQEQGQEAPIATKRRRRRSRSRSRSRSRDFKDLMSNSRPESPDDAPMPPLPFYSPFLGATTPTQLAAIQAAQLHASQGRMFFQPTSPLASPYFRSPATPTNPSPLPSLDAIRAGLIRSNSAAARMMAMRKLTGGRESPEPMSLSPSPTPSPLGRSNTVTGGERMAARRLMLRRLGERTGAGLSPMGQAGTNDSIPEGVREGDGELTSGGEEIVLPLARRRAVPPDISTPSHMWSPQLNPASNGIVDDRETDVLAVDSTGPPSYATSPTFSIPPLMHSVTEIIQDEGKEFSRPMDGVEYDGAEVRDGVVIEQPDEIEDSRDSTANHLPRSVTSKPSSLYLEHHSVTPPNARKRISSRPSEIPSTSSSTLTASATDDAIPLILPQEGQASPFEKDTFPVTISPFGTPVKEQSAEESEEEAEQVVYPEDMKARKPFINRPESESNLSWKDEDSDSALGSNVTPSRHMPVTYDIEDDEQDHNQYQQDERPHHAQSSPSPPPTSSPHSSNHPALESGNYLEPETPTSSSSPSPALGYPLHVPDAPSERTSHVSEALSAVSSNPHDHAQRDTNGHEPLTDWEEVGVNKDVSAPSVGVEEKDKHTKKALSGWDRVKAPFLSRSVSTTASGRKSRSNSFNHGSKRDDGASVITGKRESAASATSTTTATLAPTGQGASTQPAQSPSASMLSLPQPPPRGGVSPVPPASAADLAKYADHQKLRPFPGLDQLQKEKLQRDRGMSVSNENGAATTVPSTRVSSPEPAEQAAGVARQPSMSSLLQTAQQSTQQMLLPSGAVPSEDARPPSRSPSQRSYFDRPQSPIKAGANNNASGTLPTNREGVRKWLGLNAKKWLSSSTPNAAVLPNTQAIVTNGGAGIRRTSDTGTEKDNSSRISVPTIDSRTTKDVVSRDLSVTPTMELPSDPFAAPQPNLTGDEESPKGVNSRRSLSTATDSPLLPTPSTGGGQNHSPTNSLAQSNSSLSAHLPGPPTPSAANDRTSFGTMGPKSLEVLQRLDAILDQPPDDPNRANALDQPPRRLLLMSKALQVVDRNTVKDRFLFLFSDILVIAKPLDEDSSRDAAKSPLDRLFSVKSIVELHKLQFEAPKDEVMTLAGSYDYHKHPSVKIFVQRFIKDPDRAIVTFLEKTKLKNDPATVANVLFRTVELDKTQLGEYLSRRSSKAVLKAFIDRFGFGGVRIDNALRAFLLAIRLPTDSSVLEHLLANFASRWFEANISVIAFDKDLATRLVFSMMQLNDALHSDINADTTPAGGAFSFPNLHISPQDWLDAFRVLDRRMLVPDEVLRNIYFSIEKEKLAQALDSSVAPIFATISPSSLPSRLTTRTPSDLITIKIPEPDPEFGIHLQGQDLIFDPPFLSFARSSEASFRITGNSLGTKTVIFARTGPRAPYYSGIPLSRTFYVERAFMRNTFRIAFTNHMGAKRKYLFSVDSKADHTNWTAVISRQIAQCKADPPALATGTSSLKVRRAAEAVALQVLRDSLIAPEDAVVSSKQSGTSSLAMGQMMTSRNLLFPHPSNGQPSNGLRSSTQSGGNGHLGTLGDALSISTSGTRPRGSPSTGQDLLVACQQNSLIPVVLSFLNVVKPV